MDARRGRAPCASGAATLKGELSGAARAPAVATHAVGAQEKREQKYKREVVCMEF